MRFCALRIWVALWLETAWVVVVLVVVLVILVVLVLLLLLLLAALSRQSCV